jgi:hypothetical protein
MTEPMKDNSLSPIGRRAFFAQVARGAAKYGLAAAALGTLAGLTKGCVSAAPGFCGYCDFAGQDYDFCGNYCDYFNYADVGFKTPDNGTQDRKPRSGGSSKT